MPRREDLGGGFDGSVCIRANARVSQGLETRNRLAGVGILAMVTCSSILQGDLRSVAPLDVRQIVPVDRPLTDTVLIGCSLHEGYEG